jgi:hypothetical protein
MTGHCSVWLVGYHSQPVPCSNNTCCPIDVCQQEQLETVWNQPDLCQEESLNVHCWQTSMITFGMMLSTTWLDFKVMAQDPLVRREPVSASCNRRPDEGLETEKCNLFPREHPANCPLRWRLSNCLRCISHDCKLDLFTIQCNLTGDQYIRDVLQPVVPHFDNHPLTTRPVCMDNNARPHRSRAVTA